MSEQEKLRWAWLQGWKNWRNSSQPIEIPYHRFGAYFGAFEDGYVARHMAEHMRRRYRADTYHFFLGPRMENDDHVSVRTKEAPRYTSVTKISLVNQRDMVINSEAAT